MLYQKLKQAVQKSLGSFMEESLKCCIHFTSDFTFAAVKIFKDKIRVDFSLNHKINSSRITHFSPMSAHRFLHCVDLQKEKDIDDELLSWIKEAYALHL